MNIFSSNNKLIKQNSIDDVEVYLANHRHIHAMVSLSNTKRIAYEQAQPQFWRCAENAFEIQTKWFKELLNDNNYIMLCAEQNQKVIGFIIGKIILAPEVYNPGGYTLMIDDFCVELQNQWNMVGAKLIAEIKKIAQVKDAVQILVVAGHHDKFKKQFLKSQNFTIASDWFVGEIE
jgi:hypothetical protein